MKKAIIGIGILAVVVAGWFLFNHNTVTYVATVDDQVTQLEEELVTLDTAVSAGTLTSAQAYEAKAKIITRLDNIDAAIASADSAKLSSAQRKTLLDGLERLKNILTRYSATLVVVDFSADTVTDKPKLARRSGSQHTNISAIIADTINVVESNVEEVIEDYVPTEEDVNPDDSMIEDGSDNGSETSTTGDDMGDEGTDTVDTSIPTDPSVSDTELSGEATTEVDSDTSLDEAVVDTSTEAEASTTY